MRRTDGREVLVRLAYPLPLDVVGPLLGAIGKAAEEAGYTDVSLDMNDQGAIIATPPRAGSAAPGKQLCCEFHNRGDDGPCAAEVQGGYCCEQCPNLAADRASTVTETSS